MTEFWVAVVIGSIAVYSWKIFGYLIPKRFAENQKVARFAALLTTGLLASLTMVQTFASGQTLEFDSRVLAVAVGAVMFWRKLPFLLVVATATAVAALARALLGWP